MQIMQWKVTNDRSYKQSDGVSCGPIACLKVMEIYGIVQPGRVEFLSNFHNGDRTTVMDYYADCVEKYNDGIKAELHMLESIIDTRATYGRKQPADSIRKVAMEKKNLKQKESAKKAMAMERAGAAAIESGAAPGAVVSLKVDYRTHSHAQGLLAIIYQAKETGGISVCCKHKVITHSGTKGDYWVPVDVYIVIAKADKDAPLPSALQATRDQVLGDKFNPKNRPRISYAKHHELMIAASSPIKKGKRCKCKGGKCGKSCGCQKKGYSCHSR